ncbi:MAG: hypothetical protein HZB86_11565 [Deltaproteobacteria bacterium]|nr:hypothetical protein [Deltaproteobacteria bacterium]
MMFEYMDRMVMFKDTPEGLTADMSWLREAGEDGWEVVSSIPLIAPNRDGIAYGTVGCQILLKRVKRTQ